MGHSQHTTSQCSAQEPNLSPWHGSRAPVLTLIRFGKLTPDDGECALISPDEELVHSAFAWTMRLDNAAAFDGIHLALAERLQCTLWTADGRLCNVVGRSWLRLAGALS